MSFISIKSSLFILYTILFQFAYSVHAANNEKPLQSKKVAQEGKSYAPGDRIVVECLNRTV